MVQAMQSKKKGFKLDEPCISNINWGPGLRTSDLLPRWVLELAQGLRMIVQKCHCLF